jgi:mono/diheme cytochrome c family protein
MKFLLPLVMLGAVGVAATPIDLAKLPPPAARTVDFVQDIQPIFEARCAKCHGAEKQKGGYRLDDKKIALTGGDEHAPNIHPGRSAESPLIHFVAGLDPEMKMPAKGDPLTAEQIGLLRAWIDQGAVWPEAASLAKKDPLDWWSLKPLARPPVPVTVGRPKAKNPIDAFIVAKLAEKKLWPSMDADARTVIRRMTYDLTGLSPTPEEVDAFVSEAVNDWQAAIDRLADRLLASPRYGERWARHWLDVVHYGDTHGYDKDKQRPNAWPYRDYVIGALNSDKPYARFVQEQLAGDALFPNTEDGINALGFIAAGPWDFIGHAELPEAKLDGKIARLLDRDDMVSNTMNTFCAITVQCARCHNHKFDPVKQEDYYRLQAVFAALDRADKQFDLDPAAAQKRQELTPQKVALEKQKKELESTRGGAGSKIAFLEKLISEFKQGNKAIERAEFGFHSSIVQKQDEVKWIQVDLGAPLPIAQIVYVGCHDNFNNIGAGFGFPVRYKLEVSDDAKFATGVTLLEDKTPADSPNPGVKPQVAAAGKSARYIRLTATKLALRQNDYIFALAELQALDANGRNLALGAVVTSSDTTDVPTRWSRKNVVDGYYYGHLAEASPERIAALEMERETLLAAHPEDPAAVELLAVAKRLAAVTAELQKLPAPKTVYAGTVHTGAGAFSGTGASGGKPRPIFVLKRGDVRQPAEEVGPGTVPISRELPSQFAETEGQPESARRVALAQWITDERNPLTWRVIVNRVWQYHIGRGLVDSPNDFGRMGRQPTHPELLDWLAVEFRDGGGSLKKLHRLIVTSATYRQISTDNEGICPCDEGNPDAVPPPPHPGAAIDADNTLLWRMNRRKLDAESMHDSVLAIAGRLDLTMGGPGFQDFVIEHPEHSPHYEYALYDVEDPKSLRRSIYRFIVRSQPQPLMTVLDCADPSMSVDKRNESVNALQALAIRNNRLTVAMGRHFAERVAGLATDPGGQVAAVFRLALQRAPKEAESAELTEFVKQHGLANACRLIFSLNEFAFVD